MNVLMLGAFLLINSLPLSAQVKVPVDHASVMIDGRFELNEWAGAAKLNVNDSVHLYIKQDAANLYWCLHAATLSPALVAVDFYLAHNDSLLNLHASAKLGERPWRNHTYGEWVWWNNTAWLATVARIDVLEQRKFLRDEAKEFQLRKSRFGEKAYRLMFEIEYPAQLGMKYPAAADTSHTGNWLYLSL